MSIKHEIDHCGRRVKDALPDEVQNDFRRFVNALEKLADEVELLKSRLAHVEHRLR